MFVFLSFGWVLGVFCFSPFCAVVSSETSAEKCFVFSYGSAGVRIRLGYGLFIAFLSLYLL